MRDYAELILDLRRHHCDAKEDDTQEVCEECAYDVIVAGKSKFNGITDVCTCGLMHRAADAIEELLAAVPKWISVRDVSDEEICAAKMVLSVIENLDKPMIMFDIEKSAVKKALLLMLRICEAEPPKEETE